MVAEVYLDGEPLIDVEGFTWGLSEGVAPMAASILLPRSQALAIFNRAKNKARSSSPFLQLIMRTDIQGEGSKTETFNNIVVTGYSLSTFEPLNFMYVNIADNRWYWDRGQFKASFNVRTAVGDKASIDNVFVSTLDTVPREIIDKISYRSFSLYPPIRVRDGSEKLLPWNIRQILNEIILGSSAQSMKSTYQHAIEASLTAKVLTDLDDVLYEGIQLSGSHRSVLSSLLTYIPHVGIYVNRDGDIRFFDKSQGEENVISKLPAPLELDGNIEFVTNEIQIPQKIHCIFDIQSELRFDFEEVSDGDTTTSGDEQRTLSMICPVPVLTLAMPDGTTALASQPRGFDEVISALQSQYTDIPLTKELFRRFYCFHGIIEKFVFQGEIKYPTANWGEIVATLKSAYRKMYRINGNWQSKMIGIIARRASVFEPVTGTLAPSPVYQDYAYWLTTKGIFAQGDKFDSVIRNVTNWSDSGYEIDSAVPIGTAMISMLDAENGIFQVAMSSFDPMNHFKKILPSPIINSPTYDFSDKTRSHYADEGAPDQPDYLMALSPTHKMSTIISATPAPHPGMTRYIITVEPHEVSKIIPVNRLDGASGEDLWVQIPASVDMARIRWRDGLESSFEQVFGVGTDSKGEGTFPKALEELIVNKVYLKDTAKTMAASIWAKLINRYKGSQVNELQTGLNLQGSVTSILHTIASNGLLSTRFQLQEDLDVPSFDNLLTPETRAFIYGQVKKDS